MLFLNKDVNKALPTFSNNQFDLIITSPPYGIGKDYETKQSLNNYLSWQKEVISQFTRVLKDTGSIVWQVGNYVDNGEIYPLDIYFYPIFKELGFQLRNRIIWHFGHGLHCKNRFSGRYETLLWFTKTNNYKFNLDSVRVPSKYPGKKHFKGPKKGQLAGNPLGKNPSDFWETLSEEWNSGILNIPNVKHNHPEKTQHPCQFPVELVERCILALTDEGDNVLDPFSGVGTTALACFKAKRNFVAVEKEKQYIELAKSRLEKLKQGKLKIREIGTPIYQPKRSNICQ